MLGSMSNYSTPKVSVIMPVYNTELYVERAMISLMEQTLDDVQFIIIDDGSKDNSLSIIKEVINRYPNRKEQVVLISRENRGVAATRAQGIELATGDYVIHLDSDDWADSYWLQKMYDAAIINDLDVVICDYNLVFPNKLIKVHQKVESTGVECVNLLLKGMLSNMSWDKLVRRYMYKTYNINYISGLNMGEDFLVSLKLLNFAKKIGGVSIPLYYYNKTNDNSLTKIYSENSLLELMSIVGLAEEFITKSGRYNDYGEGLLFFKLSVRNCFIVNSDRRISTKKKGLLLYPESNSLIEQGRANKMLTIAYYLHKYKILFTYVFFENVYSLILKVKY
ncbi:glycosyltransferase family 2 protein [Vibrio cholerae]|uniref:glycosyltransferase family 2 protein n=1 Tax=Vibrio cholerae TaxID=666 RepID=UPI001302DD95|nr:glycosyltransferase family A protein [Vibrio cholerae]